MEGGKLVKTKFASKDEIRTRLNDYLVEVSVPVPNVKKGSVIEYTYTLSSDYTTNLKTWKFQKEIPVAYSYFEIHYSRVFFSYQLSQLGNVIPLDWTEQNTQETFTYKWETLPQAGGAIQKGTGSLSSNSHRQKAIARNVPPLEEGNL